MWDDAWFCNLDPQTMLFWVFLLTGPATEASGLYQFNDNTAPAHLHLSQRVLTACREAVESAGKASFAEGWVFVTNYIEHQPKPNPSIWTHIVRQVNNAPNCLRKLWLAHNGDRVPTACRQSVRTETDTETETETDTETEKKTSARSPAKNAGSTPLVPSELTGLKLYDYTGIPDDEKHKSARRAAEKLCSLYASRLAGWQEECPGVDIAAETRKAHGWELDNPTKRKIDKVKFLGNWFRRAQDSYRKAGAGTDEMEVLRKQYEEVTGGGNK